MKKRPDDEGVFRIMAMMIAAAVLIAVLIVVLRYANG